MKVGTVCFATVQGLGFLAHDFFRAGVVTHPVILRHSKRYNHFDWYPPRTPVAERASDLRRLLPDVDVMLYFETPHDWTLFRDRPSALMAMYECMPEKFQALPRGVICPSLLDYDCFRDMPNCVYMPVPVDVPHRRRHRACTFIHNAGNGGLRGRNGTTELLDAWRLVKSGARLIVRASETHKEVLRHLPMGVTLVGPGPVSREELYATGDAFIFPEKFNGLSLPLQEARAAGMLVVSTDRHPMNAWLPNGAECPACDGDGSRMMQLGKAACIKVGGYRKFFGNRGEWTYYTADHKEMELKTIGGDCQVCRGTKTLSYLIPVAKYRRARVGPAYREFDEAVIEPAAIAAKVDELYDCDIAAYSESGRLWAEGMSWAKWKPEYVKFLETLL